MSATPPAPVKRKVTEIAPKGSDAKFGSRAVERVQLSRAFDDPAVQERVEFLHNLGYRLVVVSHEKMIKDYVGMDDPAQASSFLGGNDGMQFATLYFQKEQTPSWLNTVEEEKTQEF